MLIIRPEQMRAMETGMLELFEERLSRHVAGKYGMSLENTRGLVRRGVRKAEEHELRTERGVALVVEFMVEEGEDFDRDPERPMVREILDDLELPELARVEMLILSRPWRPAPPEMVEDPE